MRPNLLRKLRLGLGYRPVQLSWPGPVPAMTVGKTVPPFSRQRGGPEGLADCYENCGWVSGTGPAPRHGRALSRPSVAAPLPRQMAATSMPTGLSRGGGHDGEEDGASIFLAKVVPGTGWRTVAWGPSGQKPEGMPARKATP